MSATDESSLDESGPEDPEELFQALRERTTEELFDSNLYVRRQALEMFRALDAALEHWMQIKAMLRVAEAASSR